MPDEEVKNKDEMTGNEDAGSQENAEEQQKPFQNLDLKKATCFGWQLGNKKNGWTAKAVLAKQFGWKNADVEGIEFSLKANVDECYLSLASFEFMDLDDDTRWHAWFDNSKMMWKLEICDSPKAEIQMEQIADFFKSEMMKKCAQRAADLISKAEKDFEEVLRPHLENGELLAVDEVKLSAILFFIRGDALMQDLRSCKWTSQ